MSFAWAEFLELARILVNPTGLAHGESPSGGPSEAALRTAISRAYYSAYHAAREYVTANNLATIGRIESHQDVWLTFERVKQRQGRRIKAEADLLYSWRKKADYEGQPYNLDLLPEDRRQRWQKEASLAMSRATTLRQLIAAL